MSKPQEWKGFFAFFANDFATSAVDKKIKINTDEKGIDVFEYYTSIFFFYHIYK